MIQKKDRRSARTRKREDVIRIADINTAACKDWSFTVDWCLEIAGMSFIVTPLPSSPRSHTSSAPTVLGVSQ